MPAEKGNNYAKGNKGGGRKSAYEEVSDATWLCSVWNTEQDYSALKEKVETTKSYSVKDMMLWRALNGDTQLLKAMADKMLPDKQDARSETHQNTIQVLNYQSQEGSCSRLAAEYESKLRQELLKPG